MSGTIRLRLALMSGVVPVVAAAMGLAAPAGDAAQYDTTLVSRATGTTGVPSNGASTSAAMAHGGRAVTFTTQSNLDTEDNDVANDVYRRELATATTTLVSRATGASGAKGNSDSREQSSSDDGRYIAFSSTATNLVPADTDPGRDVYIRDLRTFTTTLVSRGSGAAGGRGNGSSGDPSVSADGQVVVFSSSATNLDPADTSSGQDIYVHDLRTSTTRLVSRATGMAGVHANATSVDKGVSDDGRFVVFASTSTNLDPADASADNDIYVRDLQSLTTTLVSRASGIAGEKANASSAVPAITAHGSLVTFRSTATNLDAADSDSVDDVYVRDLQANTTRLVSRATGIAGAKGNGQTTLDSVSADGRYAIFDSTSSNLDPDDSDTALDVFVRDLQTNTTTLVSRATGAGGAKANAAARAGSLSGDGRYVAFKSSATNLDPADGNSQMDIFVRDLLGPPPPPPAVPADRDGDGVPDDTDNCPGTTNAGQRDADRDGIGDACENNEASPGPVFARTAVLRVDVGKVFVDTPGGGGFRRLRGAELLPFGTVVDARTGRMTLISAAPGPSRGKRKIVLAGGLFSIEQTKKAIYTDILMHIPDTTPRCPGASARSVVQAAKVAPQRPGLSADGTAGNRVRSRNSRSAPRGGRRRRAAFSVRGAGRFGRSAADDTGAASSRAGWTTVERCDGTLTQVKGGAVHVRDRGTGELRLLTAGQSYLARARP